MGIPRGIHYVVRILESPIDTGNPLEECVYDCKVHRIRVGGENLEAAKIAAQEIAKNWYKQQKEKDIPLSQRRAFKVISVDEVASL